jgi:hypothetical protein
MAKHKDTFNYFKEIDSLRDEIAPLIEQAGIEKDIERAEWLREPHISEEGHLPPLFTDARTEARKIQEEQKFEAYRYRIRDAVFKVSDEKLRQKLIACLRKFHALRIKSDQNDLWEKQRELKALNATGITYRGMSVAAGAGILVAAATQYGGLPAGLGALAFSVVGGLYSVSNDQARHRRDMETMTAEIIGLRTRLNETVAREVFTVYEEVTGRPEDAVDTPRHGE